jgi:spore germination protein YaaH/O-antigen ligase
VTAERLRAALEGGVLALVLFAPLPFGSVRPGAVLAVELAAAGLGLLLIWLAAVDDGARLSVPRLPLAICGGLIALGLFQIVPLPFSIAETFNPTAELIRPLVPYLGLDHPPAVSWSVAVPETTDALLRFTAYVLIGLSAAVAFQGERARRRFALAVVAAAAFQAVYGSGEYLTGRQHIFAFPKKYYLDSATGTLINRNHFATLLAIALPFALTLAIPRPSDPGRRGWRSRLLALAETRSLTRLLAVSASVLIWMGLLLSHSRAGLLAAMAAAAVVVFHFRSTRAAKWIAAAGAGVLVLLLSLELSQAPGERFFSVGDDLGAKAGRLTVWRDSRSLVAARPVLGWGFGTFESAFPTVQSADVDVRYDHAHNDWIEWLTEGGVLAFVAAVTLLAMALRHGGVASRAALVAVGLHAVWDFSLRIPAVAVLTAATMGWGYAAHAAGAASDARPGGTLRRVGRWLPALAVALLVGRGAQPGETTKLGGWVVPWDLEDGMRSVARGRYDDVFLFAARLDPEGRVVLDDRTARWPEAVRDAHQSGARVWLTVVNDRVSAGSPPAVLKDADLVHDLLASAERSAAHRDDIVAIALRLGVDGVDLDYENLPAGERGRFTAFAAELSTALHARNLALSVTVQPKSGESTAKGPGAMDWRALCASADRLQVMLYNQHNASTEPGPVAGVDWTSRVLDYGSTRCSAASLVAVLKVSGMDWGPAGARWLAFSEVSSILDRVGPRVRRTRADRVPWFTYRDTGGRHTVYFEDADSLGAKAAAVRGRGWAGIVLWSFGSEDPAAAARLTRAAQKR